jgi:hypothetical protein
MNADRDVTRIVRSWLQTDEYESADRVLDAVLDRLDTTPQRRAPWWPARRFPEMNSFAKLGIAAAVLAVAAILGISYFAGPNVGGPGPTAEPTATPISYTWPGTADPLAAGTYEIADQWDIGFNVVVTVPSGWEHRGVEIVKHPGSATGAALILTPIVNVVADPCEGGVFHEPPVGPTVDDLAAAIASIPGLDATTPTSVTFAGYPARYLETSVGESIACPPSEFMLFVDPFGGIGFFTDSDISDYWIVDVGGERILVMATRYPEISSLDEAELQEIVDSIRFEPASP